MGIETQGKIGNLTIKNRLIMIAMGVGLGEHEGRATDDFIAFYGRRIGDAVHAAYQLAYRL